MRHGGQLSMLVSGKKCGMKDGNQVPSLAYTRRKAARGPRAHLTGGLVESKCSLQGTEVKIKILQKHLNYKEARNIASKMNQLPFY
jgi:hypothetical protein